MRLNPLPILILVTLLIPASLTHAVEVVDLKCDYQADPLGIDELHPQLSWVIQSDLRGERQTAYQVQVASSPAQLANGSGDLWDSGKVPSDRTTFIPYAGVPLSSKMKCFWRVRVWLLNPDTSFVSKPAVWTMGLLGQADWAAQWITASKWFTPPAYRPPGLIVGKGGWADIDLGKPTQIELIKVVCSRAELFPVEWKILSADEPEFYHPQFIVDQTALKAEPQNDSELTFPLSDVKARYLRLMVVKTRGATKATIRQLEVFSSGKNVALMRPTREQGTAWDHGHAVFLVDGMPSQGEGSVCPVDACSIIAAPLFRKSFTIDQKVKAATIWVAALGMADVSVNGSKIGDEVLGPPFTDATKRIIYVTHDITPMIARGENVIGITLGNGYFSTPSRGFGERQGGDGPPRVMAQLDIEFDNGSHQIVGAS